MSRLKRDCGGARPNPKPRLTDSICSASDHGPFTVISEINTWQHLSCHVQLEWSPDIIMGDTTGGQNWKSFKPF